MKDVSFELLEKLLKKMVAVVHYVETLEDFLKTIDNAHKIELENQIKTFLTNDFICDCIDKERANNNTTDSELYKKIINRQDFLNLFQFLVWSLLTYDMLISLMSYDEVLQFFYGNYTQKSFSNPQTEQKVFQCFCKFVETHKNLFLTPISKIEENAKAPLLENNYVEIENKKVAIWDARIANNKCVANNKGVFHINNVLLAGIDHCIVITASDLAEVKKKLRVQDIDEAVNYTCLLSVPENHTTPMLKSFALFPCMFCSMSGVLNILFRSFSSMNSNDEIIAIISKACELSCQPSSKAFFVGGFFAGIATFGLLGAGLSYKFGLMSLVLCNLTIFGGLLLCAGFLCGVIAYTMHDIKRTQKHSQTLMCSNFLQQSLVNIQNFSKGNNVNSVVNRLVDFAHKDISTQKQGVVKDDSKQPYHKLQLSNSI